jgi:hypothetical protein
MNINQHRNRVIKVYIVTCTYYKYGDGCAHICVLKNKDLADVKVKNFHDEVCSSKHTYEEHCDTEDVEIFNLQIDIKEHDMCIEDDNLIEMSICC